MEATSQDPELRCCECRMQNDECKVTEGKARGAPQGMNRKLKSWRWGAAATKLEKG
jgi:hypothetical protein